MVGEIKEEIQARLHSRHLPIALLLLVCLLCLLVILYVTRRQSEDDFLDPYKTGEGVTSYEAKLTVEREGSLLVEEELHVVSTAAIVKGGMRRLIPARQRTAPSDPNYTKNSAVTVEILSTKINGTLAPSRIDQTADSFTITAGTDESFVHRGEYEISLLYRVKGYIAERPEYDEFFWMVTPEMARLPIAKCHASLQLPDGLQLKDAIVYGFLGVSESNPKDFQIADGERGTIAISTLREIRPGEGFGIGARWAKGLINEKDRS